jgi:hypothetical protein
MVVIPLFLIYLSFKKGSRPDYGSAAGKREVIVAAIGRGRRGSRPRRNNERRTGRRRREGGQLG